MGCFICCDMKSYYASVECVYRDLDPLKANLPVADEERSDQTICLAVSPALKAKGVPGRPRLFEAKQAIDHWEKANHEKVSYLIAVPRMAEYERVSALIYSVFLKYVAPEDVHVYSVDESFIDCTGYLHLYKDEAERQGMEPARLMAITIIRDVLATTGITATIGIGTNMYLAKVCMDIVAKKMPADKDGVRIAELNEESYCYLLWDHKPLTDFWQIGAGKAKRLEKAFLFTMGDIARKSQYDEEWFYKEFGIDGEIMIDHAWGKEPVTMKDIKSYHTDSHSLSNGQVLPRPYEYAEARNVFCEMIDVLCADMFKKKLVSPSFSWWVSYDYKSPEKDPYYSGPVTVDFYGRLHPCHSNGTVKMEDRIEFAKVILSRTSRVPCIVPVKTPFKKLSALDAREDFFIHEETRYLSMDFDLKRKPVKESFYTENPTIDGETFDIACFETVAFETVEEYKLFKEKGKNSQVLRTEADWLAFFERLNRSQNGEKRVAITDYDKRVLYSCVMAVVQGVVIESLGGKVEIGFLLDRSITVAQKLNWINIFNTGKTRFSNNDWRNARRKDRMYQLLNENEFLPLLLKMKAAADGM